MISWVMNVKHNIKLKQLIIAILVPLAVGGAAAFLTRDSMIIFDAVRKPPLAPPRWVFPVAWTALYILMGVCSYLVWASDASAPRKDRALSLYGMQLAVNFLWSFLFFALQMYLASFLWLLLLWVLVAVTIALFYHISRSAGKLMIPYLLWLTFAAYLNLGVYILNR